MEEENIERFRGMFGKKRVTESNQLNTKAQMVGDDLETLNNISDEAVEILEDVEDFSAENQEEVIKKRVRKQRALTNTEKEKEKHIKFGIKENVSSLPKINPFAVEEETVTKRVLRNLDDEEDEDSIYEEQQKTKFATKLDPLQERIDGSNESISDVWGEEADKDYTPTLKQKISSDEGIEEEHSDSSCGASSIFTAANSNEVDSTVSIIEANSKSENESVNSSCNISKEGVTEFDPFIADVPVKLPNSESAEENVATTSESSCSFGNEYAVQDEINAETKSTEITEEIEDFNAKEESAIISQYSGGTNSVLSKLRKAIAGYNDSNDGVFSSDIEFTLAEDTPGFEVTLDSNGLLRLPNHQVYVNGVKVDWDRTHEYKLSSGKEIELDLGVSIHLPDGYGLELTGVKDIRSKFGLEIVGSMVQMKRQDCLFPIVVRLRGVDDLAYVQKYQSLILARVVTV